MHGLNKIKAAVYDNTVNLYENKLLFNRLKNYYLILKQLSCQRKYNILV